MFEDSKDLFAQEDLFVGKILKIKKFDKNDCQFTFVKYGIFQKTENPNEYLHIISGKVYKMFSKHNLAVGKKGFLKKDMISIFEHFESSYKNKPEIANRMFNAYDIIQLEQKLTETYINNHNPQEDKKD